MKVFTGLLHDASGDRQGHRTWRQHPDGYAVGPLVLPEDHLAAAGAGGAADGDADGTVAVSVPSDLGAGGLLALTRRRTGVSVVAVETVLRDLADLAQNAARVVVAAQTLPDAIEVYVEVPGTSGFVDAVATIEAGGLLGRVDLCTAADRWSLSAAERLSALVEADLPFKVTGLSAATFERRGVAAVLTAVEALIDGADVDEAATLLEAADRSRTQAGLARWDDATQVRVRRRLRGLDCGDLTRTLDELRRSGLLTQSATEPA